MFAVAFAVVGWGSLLATASAQEGADPVAAGSIDLPAEGGAVVRPTFVIRGMSARDADAQGATLQFDGVVINSTAVPVTLARVTSNLELEEGKRLFEGTLPGGAVIDPGGVATVALPIQLSWTRVPGLAGRVVGMTTVRRAVPFRFHATAYLRTPTGPVACPIVYAGEIDAPLRPTIRLRGGRILKANPFDAAIELKLVVENENPFPLPSGSLRYRITLAGGDVSASALTLPHLEPAEKATVRIPLSLSLKKLGSGAVKALKGDSAVVGFHALASIGAMEWPVDVETTLGPPPERAGAGAEPPPGSRPEGAGGAAVEPPPGSAPERASAAAERPAAQDR
jgi:LEA14-like dessication related protein